jgi:outer membrane beta-barrel protein
MARARAFARAWGAAGVLAAALLAAGGARAQSPAPADTGAAAAAADSARDAVAPAGAADTLGAGASAAPDPAVSAPSDPLAPRLTAERRVRLDREARNVVRAGPGDGFAIVAVQPRGASFPVIAKSGAWYNVRLSASETGWIHASLCREYDDLADLEWKPNPRLFTRTGTFILTGYGGAYAFDRKSNSLVLGGRLGYYVFDRIQLEGGVGWSHIRRPAEIVESLFGLTLEAEDFHMLFYHLNVTWELLPGRQMVPFLTAGAGSAIMQGETEPAFNFGAGTTLFLSRRLAMRWEVRDYRFSSGSDASRVANDNIEFALGALHLF